MATVFIPSLLRDLTGGRDTVTVPGSTVRQVIDALEQSYPGVKQRLCEGDGLRRGMTVAVDTEVSRLGLRPARASQCRTHRQTIPYVLLRSAFPTRCRPRARRLRRLDG